MVGPHGFESSQIVLDTGPVTIHSSTAAKSGASPLLCIHGFGVPGDRTFRFVRASLNEAGMDLHAPDLPGYGGSPQSGVLASLHHFAAVVASIVDRLGLTRPILVGHSMGGKIALAAAVLYEGLVGGVVLVNSGGFSVYAPWLPRIAGSAWVNDLLSGNGALARVATRITPLRDVIPDESTRRQLIEMKNSHYEMDLFHTGVAGALSTLDIPALVLWGVKDPILPRSTPHRILRLIPSAFVQFLKDSGHAPMRDQPLEFTNAVAGFARYVGGQQGRTPSLS